MLNSAEKSPVLNISLAARQYIQAGFVLVAFDRQFKGPQHEAWNLRDKCIDDPARAANLFGNIGLAHAYSRTCGIDLDDIPKAAEHFNKAGIDLMAHWNAPNAVRLTSGRINRGKLLYRLPVDVAPLATRMFKEHGFEFRCATSKGLTVQDVLPPSTHPTTKQTYTWMGPGDWRDIPELPADLRAYWQSLLAPRDKDGGAAPEGLGQDDIAMLLDKVDTKELGYDEWLRVGFALHYETSGNQVGLDIWDNWSASKGGSFYTGREKLATKWEGFSLDHDNPVTLRSIAFMVDEDMSGEYEALPDEETPGSIDTGVSTDAKRPRFTFYEDHESLNRPPVEWYVKNVVPKAEVGMVYGPSGSGKSFFLYDLMAAVAQGKSWCGIKTRRARVAWIYAEGAGGASQRKLAWAREHDDKLPGFIDCFDTPDLSNAADCKALVTAIKAKGGAQIVVIDTLTASSGSADETAKDMKPIINRLRTMSTDLGTALMILVHHTGKDVHQGARGTSVLRAAMDMEIEIQDGLVKTAEVKKLKDGPTGQRFSFRLRSVIIDFDQDGDEVTSCMVEHISDAQPGTPAKTRVPSAKNQRTVLEAFREAIELRSEMPISELEAASIAEFPKPKGKRDSRPRRFQEALDGLIHHGFLKALGDSVTWP